MQKIKYARPESDDEVCGMLEEYGDKAVVLSGGQSLMPMLRQRVTTYDYVIDINNLQNRDYVSRNGDKIRIGCLARHADVADSDVTKEYCRVLAETAGTIGDQQVRNRGTFCGAIAHGDPAGDPPVIASTLNAEIVATDKEGEQVYDGDSFYNGFYETELDDTAFVTEVRFPAVEPPVGAAHEKWEPSEGAYPIASVAAVVHLEDSYVADVRIATGAIEAGPTRMTAAEESLRDEMPTEKAIVDAAMALGENANPVDDFEGSVEFKSELSKTLAKRALTTAVNRARGE